MLRSTLRDFLTQRAGAQHRRPYSIREVARGAGVSPSTVHHLMHDQITRFDSETLNRLCRYLECGPGEWLKWSRPGCTPEEAIAVLRDAEGLNLDTLTPAEAFAQGVYYALNRQGQQ